MHAGSPGPNAEPSRRGEEAAGLEGVVEVHTAAAGLRRAAAVHIAAAAGAGRTGPGHTAAAGRREADHMEADRMEAGHTVAAAAAAAAGRMVAAGYKEARHSRVHLRCSSSVSWSRDNECVAPEQELTSYLLAAACLRSWPSALRTS